MLQTTPLALIQTGTALLASALRDPAPIVSDKMLWAFIEVTDAFLVELSEAERNDESYLNLMSRKAHVGHHFFRDITPVPEQDAFHFGPELVEAFALYAEQAANAIMNLGEQHLDCSRFAESLQQFEQVMGDLKKEIAETEGVQQPVYDALSAFEACHCADSSPTKLSATAGG